VSCHNFVGLPTREFERAFLVDHGFKLSDRRADDARDWAQSWLYANRAQRLDSAKCVDTEIAEDEMARPH
jgi:hypothetical protein